VELYNHRHQFRHAFSDVEFGDRLTVDYFSRANHTFTELRQQDALVESIGSWMRLKYRV
jgi:hypothetical protein